MATNRGPVKCNYCHEDIPITKNIPDWARDVACDSCMEKIGKEQAAAALLEEHNTKEYQDKESIRHKTEASVYLRKAYESIYRSTNEFSTNQHSVDAGIRLRRIQLVREDLSMDLKVRGLDKNESLGHGP